MLEYLFQEIPQISHSSTKLQNAPVNDGTFMLHCSRTEDAINNYFLDHFGDNFIFFSLIGEFVVKEN